MLQLLFYSNFSHLTIYTDSKLHKKGLKGIDDLRHSDSICK